MGRVLDEINLPGSVSVAGQIEALLTLFPIDVTFRALDRDTFTPLFDVSPVFLIKIGLRLELGLRGKSDRDQLQVLRGQTGEILAFQVFQHVAAHDELGRSQEVGVRKGLRLENALGPLPARKALEIGSGLIVLASHPHPVVSIVGMAGCTLLGEEPGTLRERIVPQQRDRATGRNPVRRLGKHLDALRITMRRRDRGLVILAVPVVREGHEGVVHKEAQNHREEDQVKSVPGLPTPEVGHQENDRGYHARYDKGTRDQIEVLQKCKERHEVPIRPRGRKILGWICRWTELRPELRHEEKDPSHHCGTGDGIAQDLIRPEIGVSAPRLEVVVFHQILAADLEIHDPQEAEPQDDTHHDTRSRLPRIRQRLPVRQKHPIREEADEGRHPPEMSGGGRRLVRGGSDPVFPEEVDVQNDQSDQHCRKHPGMKGKETGEGVMPRLVPTYHQLLELVSDQRRVGHDIGRHLGGPVALLIPG